MMRFEPYILYISTPLSHTTNYLDNLMIYMCVYNKVCYYINLFSSQLIILCHINEIIKQILENVIKIIKLYGEFNILARHQQEFCLIFSFNKKLWFRFQFKIQLYDLTNHKKLCMFGFLLPTLQISICPKTNHGCIYISVAFPKLRSWEDKRKQSKTNICVYIWFQQSPCLIWTLYSFVYNYIYVQCNSEWHCIH